MKSSLQILCLLLFSFIMNWLTALLQIKIPGSILGIVVLFILLQTKIVRLEWVDLGAKWLLAELLLFFIPSAVGIINYKKMLAADGLSILLVMILSTFTVMVCSGLLAERIAKRKERNNRNVESV